MYRVVAGVGELVALEKLLDVFVCCREGEAAHPENGRRDAREHAALRGAQERVGELAGEMKHFVSLD